MPSLLFDPKSRQARSSCEPETMGVSQRFLGFRAEIFGFPFLFDTILQPALQNPAVNLIGSCHDK